MGNVVNRDLTVKAGIVFQICIVAPVIFCIHVQPPEKPTPMTVKAADPPEQPIVPLLVKTGQGYASLLASWGLCVIRIIVITPLYQMVVTQETNVLLWGCALLERRGIRVQMTQTAPMASLVFMAFALLAS